MNREELKTDFYIREVGVYNSNSDTIAISLHPQVLSAINYLPDAVRELRTVLLFDTHMDKDTRERLEGVCAELDVNWDSDLDCPNSIDILIPKNLTLPNVWGYYSPEQVLNLIKKHSGNAAAVNYLRAALNNQKTPTL